MGRRWWIAGMVFLCAAALVWRWRDTLLSAVLAARAHLAVSASLLLLLYMLKGIIELMIGGSALVPAFVANIPKLMTSPPNIVIAVVVAMALLPALQKAMHSTSFGRHIAEK